MWHNHKWARKSFIKCKRGLEVVTSVLVLFFMLAALVALFTAFFNYNQSLQQQMTSGHDRAQEQMGIVGVDINEQHFIENITIANTGSIQVNIRGIYRETDGVTTLLLDPKLFIEPSSSETVNIASLELIPDPDSVMFAVTERGTKSIFVNEITLWYGQPKFGDTTQLAVGPLMLEFNSLAWTSTFSSGVPQPPWQPGWTIAKGTTCAWHLRATNVDPEHRDIVLSQNTGFTLSLVGGTQAITWYLRGSSQTLVYGDTTEIVFTTDTPGGSKIAKPGDVGVHNVFLTFFGTYEGGTTLAQTIPFQTVVVT